jgi:folate-binding protein YgfZ
LDKLVGAGAEVGHLPCLEAARIEAGLPRAGWELDARSMPNEVSLQHAVDLKKGCFPGYEALAKMVNRGEPRRQLRVLVLPKGFDTPAPDTELAVEDKKIGWTASACYSPTLDTHVSLALIKTRFADLESDPGLIVGGTAAPEARLQAPPVRWGGGQALPVASY